MPAERAVICRGSRMSRESWGVSKYAVREKLLVNKREHSLLIWVRIVFVIGLVLFFTIYFFKDNSVNAGAQFNAKVHAHFVEMQNAITYYKGKVTTTRLALVNTARNTQALDILEKRAAEEEPADSAEAAQGNSPGDTGEKLRIKKQEDGSWVFQYPIHSQEVFLSPDNGKYFFLLDLHKKPLFPILHQRISLDVTPNQENTSVPEVEILLRKDVSDAAGETKETYFLLQAEEFEVKSEAKEGGRYSYSVLIKKNDLAWGTGGVEGFVGSAGVVLAPMSLLRRWA